jgi:hypothetical protein
MWIKHTGSTLALNHLDWNHLDWNHLDRNHLDWNNLLLLGHHLHNLNISRRDYSGRHYTVERSR